MTTDFGTLASLQSQVLGLRYLLRNLAQQLHIAQRHDGAFEDCGQGSCPDVRLATDPS